MIVRQIALKNFLGYRDRVQINFDGHRVVGIVGQNEAGKSTILKAIPYAIYGFSRDKKTDKFNEVDMIHSGAKGSMVVEVELELPNGKVLAITRGRTHNNEAIVELSGYSPNTKPSKLSQIIRDEVALSYQDFISLSYFVQGDIHQFMEGNKRDYFSRWTDSLKLWAQMEEMAKEELRGQEVELRDLRHDLELLGEQAEGEDYARRTLAEIEEEQKAAQDVQEAAQKAADDIQAEWAEQQALSQLAGTLDELIEQLNQINKRLLRLDLDIDRLSGEIVDVGTGRCPLVEIYCKDLEMAANVRKEVLQDELSTAVGEKQELEMQHTAVKARVDKARRKLAAEKGDSIHTRLVAADRKLMRARQDLRGVDQRVASAKVWLQQVLAAQTQLEEQKDLVEAAEVECRQWSFVRYMCGKKGVPSLIVSQELQKVEEKCNWILERLGYEKRIRFAGQRKLKEFEKVCPVCGGEKWRKKRCTSCSNPRPHKMRDEPTITVVDGKFERPFALESGGAKVLQSFAVRLACSMFVSNMSGIPLRMVILDETFAMLDSRNRRKLLALVVDKLSTTFGLQQQFVVSHHEDVTSAVSDLLVVSKERGASVARWA